MYPNIPDRSLSRRVPRLITVGLLLTLLTVVIFAFACQQQGLPYQKGSPTSGVVIKGFRVEPLMQTPTVTTQTLTRTTTISTAEALTITASISGAITQNYTYLYAVMDQFTSEQGLRLLESYADNDMFNDGDTAWLYDNSLVLLALLARGTQEDLARAITIADSLVYAQTNDPAFKDGRLRDAYHASYFIKSDGAVNIDQAGSATGNMAWATLSLVQTWQQTKNDAYLRAAQNLGQWIVDHTHDARGTGGYSGGLDAGGGKLLWKATEHNVDVYAAFMNLYLATNDPIWRERAMWAKHFLQTMWSKERSLFWTGTTLDGTTTNPQPIPEDTQSWTLLALGESGIYQSSLQWAESVLYYERCPGNMTVSGYRFSNTGVGCWWEGTAHMALAWQSIGQLDHTNALLQTLRDIQITTPDLAGKAIPAASGINANTGYGWSYPANTPHIAPVAWYLFVELSYNPFWGITTTEPIPFAGIYD